MLEIYRTGVLYHLVHALAALAVAPAPTPAPRPRPIADLLQRRHRGLLRQPLPLALTGITVLGAVTPLGGLVFLAGWALVVVEALGPRSR